MKETDIANETRGERAVRTGEMRLLKRMRAEVEEKEASKKRRILKPWGGGDDETVSDKRDIDFRIMNNQSQLQVMVFVFIQVYWIYEIYIPNDNLNIISVDMH